MKKMIRNLRLLTILLIVQVCVAPPVTKNKVADQDTKENEVNPQETGLEDYMEYHRYLKEVVDALESDPQFREKLEKAEESDIRSGKIAHELEFVSHKVRTKLDELKRTELERLRHFANKQYEIENGLNGSHGKVDSNKEDKEHVDHLNPHTFEIDDLKKLIAKSTQDLAEADRKRRDEFKEYELQKEFEKKEKLKSLDDVHRAELEKQIQDREEKHKKHQPLHHPGSKQQLEEVWEKQDHMDQQDFDPKTFFMLHDLDGNGVWDQNEVKTLFIKELDKMYSEGAPEDDMRERIEEMERMREHVFGEVDKNKDGLISYEEFLDQTKRQDFQKDEGWESLDQQRQFTDEEYQHFEKQQMEEVERLIAQGMLPPQPGAPVYHDPRLQGQQQFPPQGHHPGQVPPQYQGHPQAQYHPGQVPQMQGQYHPGQVPQQQLHPGQLPQQQLHPGQVPQQQLHVGQVPQQQMHPNQQVPPQQFHPNQQIPIQQQQQQYHPNQQVPVQQLHANQVPVQQQPQGQVPKQGNVPPQINQGQQMNNQINPNQIPPQGNPIGQGQPDSNPQLNTNEVYTGKNQVPEKQQQQPNQAQQQPPVLSQGNAQPNIISKASPQVNQV